MTYLSRHRINFPDELVAGNIDVGKIHFDGIPIDSRADIMVENMGTEITIRYDSIVPASRYYLHNIVFYTDLYGNLYSTYLRLMMRYDKDFGPPEMDFSRMRWTQRFKDYSVEDVSRLCSALTDSGHELAQFICDMGLVTGAEN